MVLFQLVTFVEKSEFPSFNYELDVDENAIYKYIFLKIPNYPLNQSHLLFRALSDRRP